MKHSLLVLSAAFASVYVAGQSTQSQPARESAKTKILGKWENIRPDDGFWQRYQFNSDGTYSRNMATGSIQGRFLVSPGKLIVDNHPLDFHFEGNTLVIRFDNGELKFTRYGGDIKSGVAQPSIPTPTSGTCPPPPIPAPSNAGRGLTQAKAQQAVNRAFDGMRSKLALGCNAYAQVQGVVDTPTGAEADLTFVNVRYVRDFQNISMHVGKAIFRKYNDGRWVLSQIQTDDILYIGTLTFNGISVQ